MEVSMSRAKNESDRSGTGRLLAGAEAIANARWCWLATAERAGVPCLRPMGRLPPEPGDDDWTIRFVTDGRSRKAADIRRAGKVALIFQRDADDAFVAVTGAAALVESASEIRQRWRDAYNRYFPTELDRANAAFLEVEAERLELWIRGVTPEPFGLRASTLERDAGGAWRLVGGDRAAA
jgi:general stress protein 26